MSAILAQLLLIAASAGNVQAADSPAQPEADPAISVPAQPQQEPATAPVATTMEPTTGPAADATLPSDGEIVVSGSKFHHAPGDPFERINAASYAITQKVDDAVVAPVARSFDRVAPRPMRRGIRNFLNNLREPVVFANYLLQLKPGKAAETVARFALNSTLGLGGVVDVAKRCPFNLPWRPNGFSDTLGVYGVKEGPYLFVPLVGPTTIRELVGGAVDRVASPIALGGPFKSRTYVVGSNIYRVIDRRAEQEDELRAVRESEDPYAARRDLYLAKRAERVARLEGSVPDTPTDATIPTEPPGAMTQPARAARGKKPRCASFSTATAAPPE